VFRIAILPCNWNFLLKPLSVLICAASSRFAFFMCARFWPEAKFYLQRWRDAFRPIAIFDQKTVISDKQQMSLAVFQYWLDLLSADVEKSSHRANQIHSRAQEREKERKIYDYARVPWQGRGRSSQLYSLCRGEEEILVRLVGTFSSSAEGPTLSSSSFGWFLFICLFGFSIWLCAGGASCKRKQPPVKIQKPDNTHLCAPVRLFASLSNAELVIAASAQPKAGPQTGFRALSAQKNLVQEMRMTNK